MVRSFFGDRESHRRRRAEASSFARRPRRGARRARRARRSRRDARGARPTLVGLGGGDRRSLPALLCSARGELDGAAATIEEAVVAHERLRIRSSSHARCSRRARSCDAATSGVSRSTLSTKSIAISRELGAPLWAERARDERRRLGLRKGSGDELTPSEHGRVPGRLGLTNRQIAERIFEPETVEATLARVPQARDPLAGRARRAHGDPGRAET
jgi:hypothetical protein